MTHSHTHARLAIAVVAITASLLIANPAAAQQQKWAAAFLNWSFDPPAPAITELNQELWIPLPTGSFEWTIQFTFAGSDKGGYLGFNRDDRGNRQMLYSLWNATDSTNGPDSQCQKFDGEGEGLSCRQPFALRGDRLYRLHLERGEVTPEGVWWSASIAEEQPPATLGAPVVPAPSIVVELGRLRVGRQFTAIDGATVLNFIEYWGLPVAQCNQLPVSALYAAPPQANRDPSTNTYASTAHVTPTTGYDKCLLGTEAEGASYRGGETTVIAQGWQSLYPAAPPSSNGALVYLGGTTGLKSLRDNFTENNAGMMPPPMTIFMAPPPTQP